MRVGEVAHRAGVSVRALRYYEKAGLVVPSRSANGYRDYDPVAVQLVRQIRDLAALGLSVEETRPFVDCLAGGHVSADECPASMAAYRRAIDDLSTRIDRLTRCRDALAAHLEAAAGRAMRSAGAPSGSVAVEHRRRVPMVGDRMPSVVLAATDGSRVDLAALGSGRTVLYVYPLTGQPDVDLPEGWDTIAGARGCTAEACGFRDHYQELREAGAAGVYGLSCQDSDYQRELVDRLRLPFAMLADPGLHAGLPTFEAGGLTFYRRLTVIVTDGLIEHVFHPIPAPEDHAAEVLSWLQSH